jgi:hypothetical protein
MKNLFAIISISILPLMAIAQKPSFQYFTSDGKAFYSIQSELPFKDVKIFSKADGGEIIRQFSNNLSTNIKFDLPISYPLHFALTNFSNTIAVEPLLFSIDKFDINEQGNSLTWHANTEFINRFSILIAAGNELNKLTILQEIPLQNSNQINIRNDQFAYYQLSIIEHSNQKIWYQSSIVSNPNLGLVFPTKINNNLNIIAFKNNNKYVLQNIQGSIIKKGVCGIENQSINVSDLQSGIYIVQIIDNAKSQSFKIVK